MALEHREARPQLPLACPPYDRWTCPDGGMAAEFHRLPGGFLVRFPDEADFAVDLATGTIHCTPISEDLREVSQSLFHNSIEPLVGNYLGGLYLHGSVVSLKGGGAIAFLGESRRGKTTLAGAFARAGFPFLAEDTVTLSTAEGRYTVAPTRPVLRLFPDSANHLLERADPVGDGDTKYAHDTSGQLPFADSAQELRAIYFLGPGTSEQVVIEALAMPAALAELMRHCFILDVEDKARLRGHFQRLSELATSVACYTLDFPRVYAQLDQVIESVQNHAQGRLSA